MVKQDAFGIAIVNPGEHIIRQVQAVDMPASLQRDGGGIVVEVFVFCFQTINSAGSPHIMKLSEVGPLAVFAPQALSSKTATMTRENTIFFIPSSLMRIRLLFPCPRVFISGALWEPPG